MKSPTPAQTCCPVPIKPRPTVPSVPPAAASGLVPLLLDPVERRLRVVERATLRRRAAERVPPVEALVRIGF